MAKRFTDTGKWDKAWFRKLTPKMKCVREFLQDRCDHAGVWEIDMETMSHFINEKVTLDEVMGAFDGQLERLGDDKIWYRGFVGFQYGDLKEDYNPHKPAIKRLQELNLLSTLGQDLNKPSLRLMDKDKDKDKEKDKDKNSRKTKIEYPTEFEDLYKTYPRREGKSQGFKVYSKEILSPDDQKQLAAAISKYSALCRKEKREAKHTKHFGSFMSCWRDYLDETPTSLKPKSMEEL